MTVMSHDDFKNISRTFNNIQTSKDIFDKYEPEDVVVVKWTSYSSENWDISPKGYTSLIDQVKTFDSFTVRLVIEYVHESNSEECGKEEKIFEQTSAPFVALQREALVNMMMTETATEPLWIPLIFPKFISIDKDGIPESVPLMEPLHGGGKYKNRVKLTIKTTSTILKILSTIAVRNRRFTFSMTKYSHQQFHTLQEAEFLECILSIS
ncbi:piezo-type mechanosensitive ion channel component 2-like [Sitophilus oryzae]|uniref:Piezo-type mechanosensitive ion channel component 2-like n=1 Tax=Sitophilus oryzae TaxID=7048 RepID=A0A6J2Y317_SITOR|nr:piezo-type mechanosensitive ion channel component 2-like [Sitophilus oryzae]